MELLSFDLFDCNKGERGKNKTRVNIFLNIVFLMDIDFYVFVVGVRV